MWLYGPKRSASEIRPFRKERIEGAQGLAARVLVATGDVSLEAKSWAQRDQGDAVTRVGSNCPCADIA
jgi:hypothetical protein